MQLLLYPRVPQRPGKGAMGLGPQRALARFRSFSYGLQLAGWIWEALWRYLEHDGNSPVKR